MSAAVTSTASPPGTTEVELSIRGMTCAACAARVEKKLSGLDDVTAAVNFATGKATVTAPASVPVARLIEAVEQAGYRADLAQPLAGPGDAGEAGRAADAGGAGPEAAQVAYLRRRLIVALVFFVPLSDLSLMLSLFPWPRFPGWQWVLVGCAAPVAGWAAWPFHQAALKNARHGAASMDTLVSLGITAACGWSVYAMFVLDRGQDRVSALQLLLHASGGGIYLEVAASVTTFLLAGRWYEARARRDAGDAMRELAAAGAREASVLEINGTERRVPAGQLRPGDRVVVRPGEVIAADGVVEFGESAVLRDDLGVIPEAIRLARATLATIRRNLAWAFGYNVAAIPLAAAGFLNPLIAGAAMAASSAFVVASSIRLRRFGTGQRPEKETLSCPG